MVTQKQQSLLERSILRMVERKEIGKAINAIENHPSIARRSNDHGHTLLACAIDSGSTELVGKVLDAGVSVNAAMPELVAGLTAPLDYAVVMSDGAMCRLMVERGADLERKVGVPAHDIASGETFMVRFSYLELAALYGKADAVNVFLTSSDNAIEVMEHASGLAEEGGFAECVDAIRNFARVRNIRLGELRRDPEEEPQGMDERGRLIARMIKLARDRSGITDEEIRLNSDMLEIMKRDGDILSGMIVLLDDLRRTVVSSTAAPDEFMEGIEKLGPMFEKVSGCGLSDAWELMADEVERHRLDLFGVNAETEAVEHVIGAIDNAWRESCEALFRLRRSERDLNSVGAAMFENRFGSGSGG